MITLIRIFTNKAVNFKLTIIPTHLNDNNKNIEKIKKNTKITYHFTTNVLNFPNNIKQIYTKFTQKLYDNKLRTSFGSTGSPAAWTLWTVRTGP